MRASPLRRPSLPWMVAPLVALAACDGALSGQGGGGADATTGSNAATGPNGAGSTASGTKTTTSSGAGPSGNAASTSTGMGNVGGSAPVGDCNAPSHVYNAEEQALVDMPANTWKSVPGTDFLSACEPVALPYQHGVEGCGAVVHSWSGGVWTGRQLLVWGGGHGAYHGNEVYGFDPATMSWSALTEPSPVMEFDQDPQVDGSPVSRHTYNQLAWASDYGQTVAFGGAISTTGGNSYRTWMFDESSRTWTDGGEYPHEVVATFEGASAYDPITRLVYVHDEKATRSYDPATRTWSTIFDGAYFGTKNVVISPQSRLMFGYGKVSGENERRLLVMNLDTLADESAGWEALRDGWGSANGGADVDLATNNIVTWDDNRWGTFGRFRYLPQYNVFILVNDEYSDVMFFKATAGCGG